VRHESRTAAIKRRLQTVAIVRLHSRYLRREYQLLAWFVGKGLSALLRWLSRRARRQRGAQPRLWRRYAATVVELHRRDARLERTDRRRHWSRPPVRVRWVIAGRTRNDRVNEVLPPRKCARVIFSRRAHVRSWLASTKRRGDA
jgi:hypothetical protein